MSASAGSVLLDILPNVAGLSAKLKESASVAAREASAVTKIEPQVDGAGSAKKFGSGFLTGIKDVAIAAGAALAAKSVVDFGKDSVAAFTDTARAAALLNRSIGGTVEDSSRLIFAANESGVSTDKFGQSMKLLERNIVSVGGKAPAGAAALKEIGVSATDAHGAVKPMSELMPELAEKFAELPNGAEKSALAMKLFGKSGLDMLPLLNKGKEGIAELTAESDKYGHTISGPQAAAVKDNIVAQRQFNAALEGVKIQLGAQLLPIITTFTNFLRSSMLPAILSVTAFLKDHASVLKVVALVVTALVIPFALYEAKMRVVAAVTQIYAKAQLILNAVMSANPIGIVIIAIVALVAVLVLAYQHSETFRNIVNAAWAGVQAAVKGAWENVIRPAVQGMVDFWQNVLGPAISFLYTNVIQPVWSAISTVVTAYINIVRGVISAVMDAIHGNWSGAWDAIKGVVGIAWTFIQNAVSAGIGAIGSLFSGLGGRILGAMGDLGSLLFDAGKSIVTGLISGMTSMVSSVASTASNLASSAVNAVKGVFQHGSPSKVFIAIGKDNGRGLAIGMNSMSDHVANAGAAMAGAAIPSSFATTAMRRPAATGGPQIQQTFNIPSVDAHEVASIASGILMFSLRSTA